MLSFLAIIIKNIQFYELNENISTFNKIQINLDKNNIKKSCELVRNLLGVSMLAQKKKNDIAKT